MTLNYRYISTIFGPHQCSCLAKLKKLTRLFWFFVVIFVLKFFEFEREFLNLSSRNFQGEVQGEVSGGALRGSFQGEVLSFVYWAMKINPTIWVVWYTYSVWFDTNNYTKYSLRLRQAYRKMFVFIKIFPFLLKTKWLTLPIKHSDG